QTCALPILGLADTALMFDHPGRNVFVSAGHYAYMYGPNYFHYVTGPKYVYAYSLNSDDDFAYHYDGSGPSVYVVSGSAYSFMLGTDQGQSFFNEAVGFNTTHGLAQHPSQDVAYFYDSAISDVFVGYSLYSYL